MAWPDEAGSIAPVRGRMPRRAKEQPASTAIFALKIIPPPDVWAPDRGVHPVRNRLVHRRMKQPRSRLTIHHVAAIRFYGRFRGYYRIFNAAVYRIFRSNTGPPLETDTPISENPTLPITIGPIFPDGIWYISVSYFNGVLDSGFLPLGEHGETYLRLEISGGTVLNNPPLAPINPELELRPGGVVRIKAAYQQAGTLRATEWAITYTTDGSAPGTPPAVSPTLTSAMPATGAVLLEYDLPAQADGVTVKVRLQTRRNDAGTWRYSENSIVLTAVADALGPDAPLTLHRWPGRLPEGV